MSDHVVVRWGIVLPNGDVSWNDFQGFDLNSVDGRRRLVAALSKAASNLGFFPQALLGLYKWAQRTELVAQTVHPLGHPPALGTETGDASGDQSTGSSDGGAVHAGPMGGDS